MRKPPLAQVLRSTLASMSHEEANQYLVGLLGKLSMQPDKAHYFNKSVFGHHNIQLLFGYCKRWLGWLGNGWMASSLVTSKSFRDGYPLMVPTHLLPCRAPWTMPWLGFECVRLRILSCWVSMRNGLLGSRNLTAFQKLTSSKKTKWNFHLSSFGCGF